MFYFLKLSVLCTEVVKESKSAEERSLEGQKKKEFLTWNHLDGVFDL